MKDWGIGLVVTGLVLALLALVMDTTVYSAGVPSIGGFGGIEGGRTQNLGKLQLQELIFIGGCTLFLAGVVLVSAGQLESIGGTKATHVSTSVPPRAPPAGYVEESENEREDRLDRADADFNRVLLMVLGAVVVLGTIVWLVTAAGP